MSTSSIVANVIESEVDRVEFRITPTLVFTKPRAPLFEVHRGDCTERVNAVKAVPSFLFIRGSTYRIAAFSSIHLEAFFAWSKRVESAVSPTLLATRLPRCEIGSQRSLRFM